MKKILNQKHSLTSGRTSKYTLPVRRETKYIVDLKPMLTPFVDFVWVDLSLNHIRLLSFIKVNHQGITLCARGKVVIIN